jgi:REP-associated tyrosine transposase
LANLFQNKYRIQSARLKDYDYSTPNWYYVTICTKAMKCWFGEIKNGKVMLNKTGKMIEKIWEDIPNHYKAVELDSFIIMPNHLHGIIIVNFVETGHAPSLQPKLGNIIGSFKSTATRRVHKNFNNFKWQSRFYDHIIRNEDDLSRIRNYIHNNPLKWEMEEYFK